MSSNQEIIVGKVKNVIDVKGMYLLIDVLVKTEIGRKYEQRIPVAKNENIRVGSTLGFVENLYEDPLAGIILYSVVDLDQQITTLC